LVQKDVLYSGAIGDRVAVEEDARRCRKVEGGNGAAITLQCRVKAVDELGGGCITKD
jgi:hypothetical protein